MSGASAEVVWDVGSLYDADPDTLDELYGPLPTNDMIVINVAYEDMDPAGPRELSADTVTKIDELFAADPVLGDRDTEKFKAAVRKVGCTPNRLHTEFAKRHKEAGTQRAAPVARLSADTVTKIDELYAADPVIGSRDSEKCKAAARKVGCTPRRLQTEFAMNIQDTLIIDETTFLKV